MDEVEEEMAAVIKPLGQVIEGLLNEEGDVQYVWVLMVISVHSGKASFIGNEDRDAMIEMMKKAADKATDAFGPPTKGSG